MSPVVMMTILIGVLAVAMLTYFAVMWTKEKGRSDSQGADPARRHTDPAGTGRRR